MSSEFASMVRAAKADGDLSAIAAAIPYANFVHFGVERVAPADGKEEVLHGHLRYAEHLIGDPTLPALHGGTIGALMELTATFQLLWASATLILPKTINFTVTYLRSGRPVDTFARAFIERRGKRIATVRTEAWQADPTEPIAIATANFLIESVADVGS